MSLIARLAPLGLLLGAMLLLGCATSREARPQVGQSVSADPAQSVSTGVTASTDQESASSALAASTLAESDQKIQDNIEYISSMRGITVEEVVAMVQAQVDEAVILQQIRSQGMAIALSSKDLIHLKQSGVNARIIAAMQESPPSRRRAVMFAGPRSGYVRRYYCY